MDDVVARKPILVGFYETYLQNQDSAQFTTSVSQRYHCVTLERLASIGDRTTRRAAVLAIGYLGDYSSNPVIGMALSDRDRGVRSIAENAIRELWSRIGSRQQRQSLHAVIRANEQKDYEQAVKLATELIHQSPWIAEAWCQRGTALYHMGDYEAAICDCHQALEINPYHFTAAAGMGQCYQLQDDLMSALESYRRALRLNPNLEEVRAQVIRVQKQLQEQEGNLEDFDEREL